MGLSNLPPTRKWRNWQTHQLEGLTLARAWGFESPLPHQHLTDIFEAVLLSSLLSSNRLEITFFRVGPEGDDIFQCDVTLSGCNELAATFGIITVRGVIPAPLFLLTCLIPRAMRMLLLAPMAARAAFPRGCEAVRPATPPEPGIAPRRAACRRPLPARPGR